MEMVRAAEANDLRLLAITDHLWRPFRVAEWLRKARAEIEDLETGVEVLLGVELTGTRVGEVSVSRELRRCTEIIICEHPIPQWSGGGIEEYLELVKRGVEYVVSVSGIDVLAHPLNLGRAGVVKDFRHLRKEFLSEVAQIIASSGVVVEVMSQMYWWYPQMPVDAFTDAYVNFVRICKHYGISFSIGSDAHSACGVGNTRWSLKVLDRAGVSSDEIWLPHR